MIGYYTQDGLEPPADKRIIEIVKDVAEVIPLGKGREMSASAFLFHFGFNHDTQYNYFNNLSGGERRKLFLLMTLMKNPNFLLLDEPTNDLDIYTLNILEEFLKNFEGCVLFVSHDRYFIDKIADHIFVFEENGKIKDYYDSYSTYHKLKIKRDAALRKQANAAKPKKEYIRNKEEKVKLSYKEKQEFETLEKDIHTHESEKLKLLGLMNRGDANAGDLQTWSIRYAELEHLIEIKTNRWMELSEMMD